MEFFIGPTHFLLPAKSRDCSALVTKVCIDVINSKARSFESTLRCQILSDGVSIGSGTLARDLEGITIWTPWSLKW